VLETHTGMSVGTQSGALEATRERRSVRTSATRPHNYLCSIRAPDSVAVKSGAGDEAISPAGTARRCQPLALGRCRWRHDSTRLFSETEICHP